MNTFFLPSWTTMFSKTTPQAARGCGIRRQNFWPRPFHDVTRSPGYPTLASFAAAFRLVPPHKRLLNRAIHSFPGFSQSHFTYYIPVGWPWPREPDQNMMTETSNLDRAFSPVCSNLVFLRWIFFRWSDFIFCQERKGFVRQFTEGIKWISCLPRFSSRMCSTTNFVEARCCRCVTSCEQT